jgi:hypothetical protein
MRKFRRTRIIQLKQKISPIFWLQRILFLFIFGIALNGCVNNYDIIAMHNKHKEKESLKKKSSNIPIYWADHEIGKNYIVVSTSEWSPLTFFPFYSRKKAITNKWIGQAAKNCEKLKGDAVIMGEPGNSRVIKFSDQTLTELGAAYKMKGLGQASKLGLDENNLSIKNFKNLSISWLGVDYSEVKFVGIENKYKNETTLKSLITQSNLIIEKEVSKFNFSTYFNHSSIIPDFNIIKVVNSKLIAMDLVSQTPRELTENDIKSKIKSYSTFSKGRDLGLVIIAENINKLKKSGSYWIVVFNTHTKEVIKCARIKGRPSGNGFTNYWVNSIAASCEQIDSVYETWLK